MAPKFHHRLLALAVASLMIVPAWADDSETTDDETSTNTTHLGTLKVTTKKKAKQGKLGERTISRQQLNEENIQNAHDLVRYNTEVDVAEVGRYGNKGFAVRGVDGNRVAMNIDGVALPEVESNEIYSPYGYNYEGRFNPDVEMLGGVRVTAGADSLLSGSGAVGGAISYSTKEPYHLVRGDRTWGGYAKLGYTSKNEEKLASVGLAGIYNRAEFLLNYSRRDGHELKNHDMKGHKKERMNIHYNLWENGELGSRSQFSSALYPDASKHKQDGVLGKFYYHLNDNHRLGLSAFYQSRTYNAYLASKNPSGAYRTANDKEELITYGINYRFQPSEGNFLDTLEANYQYQDTKGTAETTRWDFSRKADELKIRPLQTKGHNLKLHGIFLPIDWGKFGTHQLSVTGNYAKQDFTQSKPRLNYTFNFADQENIIPWADAKKDIYSLILNDNIDFGSRLKANLGIRYDYYKYSPYFQNDIWFGLADSNENSVINKNINNTTLTFYRDYRDGFYNKKLTFDNISYHGAFDYQIIPNRLSARYKVGTGFLAPTITHTYSAFQGQGVTQLTNTNIKPETSLNQELELEFRPTNNTLLSVAGYVSKYDDFIHGKFWKSPDAPFDPAINGCTYGLGLCMQYQNLDSAEVKGLKVGIEADLSEKLKTNGKFSVFANYHTAKDSAIVETDHNGKLKINTLAATPTSLILGADYVSANNDWSIHGRIRGLRAKKAEDAKYVDTENIEEVTTRVTECPYAPFIDWCELDGYLFDTASGKYLKTRTTRAITGYNEVVKTYDHVNRGKNAVIYDLYGTKKFGKDKQFILNGGIYNITNVKYIPWETLRQFANPNANSLVDTQGYGFNRYTAPGRNFALSLTYEF